MGGPCVTYKIHKYSKGKRGRRFLDVDENPKNVWCEGVDIKTPQDRFQWQVVVNMLMNMTVYERRGNSSPTLNYRA
jgi:hypothetical protein